MNARRAVQFLVILVAGFVLGILAVSAGLIPLFGTI